MLKKKHGSLIWNVVPKRAGYMDRTGYYIRVIVINKIRVSLLAPESKLNRLDDSGLCGFIVLQSSLFLM